jgi:hypothetical protein
MRLYLGFFMGGGVLHERTGRVNRPVRSAECGMRVTNYLPLGSDEALVRTPNSEFRNPPNQGRSVCP